MSLFPESEPKIKPVEERPEEISPLTIEKKEVVQPRPTQFTQKINDDQGKALIETPQDRVINIELPTDPDRLNKLSKGSISDSLTWFAAFWVRILKKAIHFNWKVSSKSPVTE